jgi:hypothetical protein
MLKKPKKRISLSKQFVKVDKLLQQVFRELFPNCLVCGKPTSCAHHYYPKSTSTFLRYHWNNLIPLCVGCHFSHHNGNPDIHSEIDCVKGDVWRKELWAAKKQGLNFKPTKAWLEEKINALKLMI